MPEMQLPDWVVERVAEEIDHLAFRPIEELRGHLYERDGERLLAQDSARRKARYAIARFLAIIEERAGPEWEIRYFHRDGFIDYVTLAELLEERDG